MIKVCVIAPHPDDEIISCAYIIRRYIRSGAKVFILFLTNGDFVSRNTATVRAKESLNALQTLSVSKENVTFLGYADTGMKKRDSMLYSLWNSAGRSFTGIRTPYHPLSEKTYHMQQTGIQANVSYECFYGDLFHYLSQTRPDVVYVPDSMDRHGDHASACLITTDVCSKLLHHYGYCPIIYTYLIHWTDLCWPNRKGDYFSKPIFLQRKKWDARLSYRVNKKEQQVKSLLLHKFQSQFPNKNRKFLVSFAKREEIFWLLSKKNIIK